MMPLSLIGKINANNMAGDGVYPFTDANTRIMLDADDGNNLVSFAVNSVNPIHARASDDILPEFNGSYQTARQLAWTVTFTDSRILYWAPEVVGPFGKVKPGDGKVATLGHMKYEFLVSLSVGNDSKYAGNEDGVPEIEIESWHNYLRNYSTKCFIAATTPVLRAMLEELAKRYIAYARRHGALKPEKEANLLRFAGFVWEGGKGLAFLDLTASSTVVETIGTPQFNAVRLESQTAPLLEKPAPTPQENAALGEALFCINCGQDLRGASATARFCPKCGTEFTRR